MKIEVGKRYRAGVTEGIVLSTTRPFSEFPIVFMDDYGNILFFNTEGISDGEDGGYNLTEIPKSYWINVYRLASPTCYFSKEDADEMADSNRIACVKVLEGEFHEG